MEATRPFIATADIIRRRPESKIISMEDLMHHVHQREGFFISRLGAISMQATTYPHPGWDDIFQQVNNGRIDKKWGKPSRESLFTARRMCFYASFALRDGLAQVSNGFTFEVISILASLYTKNEFTDLNEDIYVESPHAVVAAKHNDTEATMIFDATYGQIDHRQAGKILAVEGNLAKFYLGNPDLKPNLETDRKTYLVKTAETDFGLKEVFYQRLVETLL